MALSLSKISSLVIVVIEFNGTACDRRISIFSVYRLSLIEYRKKKSRRTRICSQVVETWQISWRKKNTNRWEMRQKGSRVRKGSAGKIFVECTITKERAGNSYFILSYSGRTLLHDQSRSNVPTFTSESNNPFVVSRSQRFSSKRGIKQPRKKHETIVDLNGRYTDA